jgi:aryl-alcohol dehydrogenase-like predicted oxidoreductase
MHCWDSLTPIEETLRALDDLVTAGKIRYIGFSDTPAWKAMEAQMIAKFRGWAPLIAFQLEYSLLERTIEGDLIPMALEQGIGVTPWSPLKSGILSGKYTRANAGQVKPDRGEFATSALTEKAYAVIDELVKIAAEIDSTPARVAISWVQRRPGVASSIIGARTLKQLEDNLAALEVKLRFADEERLDALTAPKLNFPYDFIKNGAGRFSASGTTINGLTAPVNSLAPTGDSDRY